MNRNHAFQVGYFTLYSLSWWRLLLRPGHLMGVPVAGLGGYQVGEKTDSPQTAAIVVIKQSLGSWSHLWSLSNVSGCGSTSLFGSHAGTHQIRDQSRPLEDRNDSNNSLEVYTPNSFIHLFYNSLYMDVVDMHNVIITPSDSVLLEMTMEAFYLVGSFPCQFNFISVFDIPVWDDVWEQATSRHFCPFRQAAHSIYPLSPHQEMVGTLESRIRQAHLYLSQQIGVRSSKTSQCGSANRPSVVP